jgi:hypothetical protein
VRGDKMNRKTLSILASLFGLIIIIIYLNFAVGLIHFSKFITLILAFSIAPVVIWGIIELYTELSKTHDSIILKLSVVYLVIAFAFFLLMLVVQQAIFISFKEHINKEADEIVKNNLKLILKGLNLVQLGMDIAFDIFYSLGLIFMSIVLMKHEAFGKIFGIYGIASGSLLLIFNLYTFPIPPSESGLFDAGPLTAIWWIWIVVQIMRKRK